MNLSKALLSIAVGVPAALSAAEYQSLSSFVDAAGQHVVYVSGAGHVNQLYFGSSWTNQDLTAMTGGPTAAAVVTSFVDSSGHEHIGYISPVTSHVNQLYFNGGAWSNQDITASAGGNLADANYPMTSYVDHSGGQHICYIDASANLNQYYNNGADWVYQNITAAGHGNPVLYSTLLSSFVDSSNYQHIAYEDTGSHINQILYNGAGWINQTLSNYGGTPDSYTPLTAFLDSSQGQHIAYVDSSLHIDQLYYNRSTWVNQNLSSLAGSGPGQNDAITSFIDGANGLHVAWIDSSSDINVLTSYGGVTWSNQNVTAAVGGSPDYRTCLTSWVDSSGGLHIAYISAANGHAYQLYWNGSAWANQDITALGGGSNPQL